MVVNVVVPFDHTHPENMHAVGKWARQETWLNGRVSIQANATTGATYTAYRLSEKLSALSKLLCAPSPAWVAIVWLAFALPPTLLVVMPLSYVTPSIALWAFAPFIENLVWDVSPSHLLSIVRFFQELWSPPRRLWQEWWRRWRAAEGPQARCQQCTH